MMKLLLLSAHLLMAASIPLATGAAVATGAQPVPEVEQSGVGFDSVADAVRELGERPGIAWHTENGWQIATEESTYSIWSFAPPDYPAYPAVVLRRVLPQVVGSKIEMSVLCEASKRDCDELVRTFAKMNGFSLPKN